MLTYAAGQARKHHFARHCAGLCVWHGPASFGSGSSHERISCIGCSKKVTELRRGTCSGRRQCRPLNNIHCIMWPARLHVPMHMHIYIVFLALISHSYYTLLCRTRLNYTQYYTALYYTMLHRTNIHYALLYYITLFLAIPYIFYCTVADYTIIYYVYCSTDAIPHYAMLCCTVREFTIRYSTILQYTMLYYTVLYYAIPYLYYTMLYCTIIHRIYFYYTMLNYIIRYCPTLYYASLCSTI